MSDNLELDCLGRGEQRVGARFLRAIALECPLAWRLACRIRRRRLFGGVSDRNTTLWSSWALKSDKHNVFFSGDTGLTDELSEIGKRLGPFDLIMLEIGASHPAWANIHLGPRNALRAFEMLGGGTLLPIHWSTFDLALHKWDEPAETLLMLGKDSEGKIVTPPLGRAIEPELVDGPTPWWRDVDR